MRHGAQRISIKSSAPYPSHKERHGAAVPFRVFYSVRSPSPALLAHPRVEGVAQAIIEEGESQRDQGDTGGRLPDHGRGGIDVGVAVLDHAAPGGTGRANAKADVAE